MSDHIDAPMLTHHLLIVSRIRARISNAKKSPEKKTEKYVYEKMIMAERQDEYKRNLTEHFQDLAINSDDSLYSRWNKIAGIIHKTAEEVFGKASRKQ